MRSCRHLGRMERAASQIREDMMSTDVAQRDLQAPIKTKDQSASRIKQSFSKTAYPLATFMIVLLAWQFLARPLGIPAYILPIPSEFLADLVASRALIAQHTLETAWETILGFVLSTVISIPLGYFIVRIVFLERTLYPLIVAFKIIPKVAIAPLFIVWFGFGLGPKI